MTKYLILAVSLLILSISMAFGVEQVSVPGESMVDAFINFLSSPTGAIVAGGVVEFVLRFVKSEKSLGLIQLIGHGFVVFGKGAVALGEFMDKVLGQRKK